MYVPSFDTNICFFVAQYQHFPTTILINSPTDRPHRCAFQPFFQEKYTPSFETADTAVSPASSAQSDLAPICIRCLYVWIMITIGKPRNRNVGWLEIAKPNKVLKLIEIGSTTRVICFMIGFFVHFFRNSIWGIFEPQKKVLCEGRGKHVRFWWWTIAFWKF